MGLLVDVARLTGLDRYAPKVMMGRTAVPGDGLIPTLGRPDSCAHGTAAGERESRVQAASLMEGAALHEPGVRTARAIGGRRDGVAQRPVGRPAPYPDSG